MKRNLLWKVVFILVLVALAGVATIPTYNRLSGKGRAGQTPSRLAKLFPGVTLGLDLQGGIRLTYEVQVDEAVEDKRDRLAEAIVASLVEKAELKDVKIVSSADREKFDLIFPAAGEKDSDDVKEVLKSFRQSVVQKSEGGKTLHMELVEDLVKQTKDIAVKQAIETIGNRIDELGLVNTSVAQHDIDIIVEIPADASSLTVNEAQVARIKRIISTTARLEFKIVDEAGSESFFKPLAEKIKKDDPIKMQREQERAGDEGMVWSYYLEAKDDPKGKSGRQLLKEFLKDVPVPSDRSIGFQKKQVLDDAGNPTADVTWRTFYLERTAGITGDSVENAVALNDDQTGQPYVSLDFDQQGAKTFADLTEKNVKRRMAIQLDDKVNSAPVIQEKIGGGRARITLGGYEAYSKLFQEAQDLVVVLRAGALPAPLKAISETTIGPALGNDSINMGKWGSFVGTLAVVLFMLVYYRGCGVAADIALVANGIFILGILSAFGATLTLPGIAGIAITFGMAVDANVIIYERIREELREGKSPRAAVENGYKRAFWTIFDSQLTTAIAGVVMLEYGTGAIKGFAVTLLIGIFTSLFTAIYISKIFVDWMTNRSPDQLSI